MQKNINSSYPKSKHKTVVQKIKVCYNKSNYKEKGDKNELY